MGAFYQLEFEQSVRDIEERIERAESGDPGTAAVEVPALGGVQAQSEQAAENLPALRADREKLLKKLYTKLSPWDTVRVARHPGRPQTRDYIGLMCRDFVEVHGDRRFGDDPAIVTGFARLGRHKVLIIGHQKGKSTKEKIECHFGCAHPEGYRKALSKMRKAEKFGIPIVTLVDTPGAYPGLGAEERGQAEAIAFNLREMSRLRTPIVSVIIGEGGSGGALGIAVANKVGMMRHAWYSVISPEGCAAILWKQANEQTNSAAAKALKMTAEDNLRLGIIDGIVEEPVGAAHRDPQAAADNLRDWIEGQLDELGEFSIDELVEQRYERFRKLGSFDEVPEEAPEAVEGASEA
ncbi:MAG: acetyl-CoA carboxylase carboxyl transferase subunit alpha [Phycisphaerales bacterium]|jgi:acetyl-CoA carboxylase carboxyl transferase subunit alpha